ncbi:MAG: hypothetical protein DMG35_12350 [Acidobacteria bacterium]|nr:MAG: hypothetical protein DMG35_12350 [Acidobacteriota bacterium]
MKIPEQLHASAAEEAKKKEVRRQLDFAYACFALLGLTMLAFEAEAFVDAKNQGAYAMTIGLLLLLPSMLAFVLAICLTVMRRRYRPIVVFCLLTMLLLALAIGSVAMAWIYGAVSMLVPAWWFTVGRWRNAIPPRSLG